MNLTDSRLSQGGCEKLDLAMLSFFEQFRKIYVGDQVQKTSKVSLIDPSAKKYIKNVKWVRYYVVDQVYKCQKDVT